MRRRIIVCNTCLKRGSLATFNTDKEYEAHLKDFALGNTKKNITPNHAHKEVYFASLQSKKERMPMKEVMS